MAEPEAGMLGQDGLNCTMLLIKAFEASTVSRIALITRSHSVTPFVPTRRLICGH